MKQFPFPLSLFKPFDLLSHYQKYREQRNKANATIRKQTHLIYKTTGLVSSKRICHKNIKRWSGGKLLQINRDQGGITATCNMETLTRFGFREKILLKNILEGNWKNLNMD